jgi:hypothetical protein
MGLQADFDLWRALKARAAAKGRVAGGDRLRGPAGVSARRATSHERRRYEEGD